MKRGEEDVDWKSVLESGWYQVALERDGVRAEEWARSGVRLVSRHKPSYTTDPCLPLPIKRDTDGITSFLGTVFTFQLSTV